MQYSKVCHHTAAKAHTPIDVVIWELDEPTYFGKGENMLFDTDELMQQLTDLTL